MAAQQIQIAETIRAMKLALKRRPDESDSDSDIETYTNRNNKLKRNARYVRAGHLNTTGDQAYKKRVTHAGYTRSIISKNSALYDSDGEPFSPTSSDLENERYGEALHDDPFGDVQLDQLLKPLTSAGDLIDHPSLSAAYKSKALTQMAEEAAEMVRREKAQLWKAKRLLQRFRGDADWVPCAAFESAGDEALLNGLSEDDATTGGVSAVPSITTDVPAAIVEAAAEHGGDEDAQKGGFEPNVAQESEIHVDGDAMDGVETADMATVQAPDGQANNEADPVTGDQANNPDMKEDLPPAVPPTTIEPTTLSALNPTITEIRKSVEPASSENASNSGSNAAPSHAMTTRARARSPIPSPSPSPSPSDSASIPAVHPWFLTPPSSLPDRDLALPVNEAEDTRKLLLLYCQKQEQIVRSLEQLFNGLQRAESLRHHVYASCKAESAMVPDGKGNLVNPMTDGEDYYDLSAYGPLETFQLKNGDLEKGKDEVEDVEEEGRRGGRRRGRRVV